jgi:hypothetical protein
MKKNFLLLVLGAMLAITGCQKEKGGGGSPTTGSSKILKRIVETENGVTTSFELTYDGSKRLSVLASNDGAEITRFTYDHNGNVVKVENKVDDIKNIFEFTYNNGVPLAGNFKSYELNGSIETLSEAYDLAYTIANGVVTQIRMIFPADPVDGTPAYEINYDLSYDNGNLTRVLGSGFTSYSASFTYGSKKPVFPVVCKYILDPSGFSMQFFAKNEILSMTYDFPGRELDKIITTSYTYDAEGYVLTANDGKTESKFEYQ